MKTTIFSVLMVFLLAGCAFPVNPVDLVGMSKDEYATLEQKANAGDLEAQYRFGMAHCCGNDGRADNAIATKWLCSAAKKGHVQSQYKIGKLYQSNKLGLPGGEYMLQSLPGDNKVALAWFIVADKNGHAKAKDGIEIFRGMEFVDVVDAIDMSRKFPEIACEIAAQPRYME
ncbi:MAG: hypothetical protein GC136_03465 [Alphaproteobacteria bacterium]|nr:hypothetical protein [Alphaproteobacteria bacterium]